MASRSVIIVTAVVIILALIAIYFIYTQGIGSMPSSTTSTTLTSSSSSSTSSTTSMSSTSTSSTSSTTTSSSTTSTTTSTTSSTSTSTTTSTSTSTSTSTTTLPSGAYALPYNSANHTVFLYIVTLASSTNLLNFNGTSNGQLQIYIPANWTAIIYYTNQESLNHNFNIVQNDTPVPNSASISGDGKILLTLGPSVGISSGTTVSGSIVLPTGIYWFACGISGHAQSGMWGVIVVSNSVKVPYAIMT